MPAKVKKHEINLLPEVDFEYTTKGRVITWLLGGFRIIVILTELVVVSAFFLRFGLDAKSSDLEDEIEQKTSLIASYSVVESKMRSLQQKVDVYAKNSTFTPISSYLEDIKKAIPASVILSNLSITHDGITIEGNSSTEKTIQQLLANIGSFSYVKTLRITKIEQNKENPALTFFSIHITLKS